MVCCKECVLSDRVSTQTIASETFVTKTRVLPITHLNLSSFTTYYLTIGEAYLLALKNLGTVNGYESVIPF
jgi:hypothetical protein